MDQIVISTDGITSAIVPEKYSRETSARRRNSRVEFVPAMRIRFTAQGLIRKLKFAKVINRAETESSLKSVYYPCAAQAVNRLGIISGNYIGG
jgi:hypothetical protein